MQSEDAQPPRREGAFRARLRRWLRMPEEPGPRGAAWGALVAFVALTVSNVAVPHARRAFGWGPLLDPLVAALLFAGSVLASGVAVALLLALLRRLPGWISWRGTVLAWGAIVVTAIRPAGLWLVVPFVTSMVALGATLGVVLGSRPEASPWRRRLAIAGAVLSGAGLLATAALILFEPPAPPLATAVPSSVAPAVDTTKLRQPGPRAVTTWSYGVSGTGVASVDGESRSVDATAMLRGVPWSFERRSFFGVTPAALPLNGRLWLPEGTDEPAPLVVVVHGDRPMATPSADGFGYLAEHLASHGFATAVLDQTFLNGYLMGEMQARAWLTMEHLALFRDWLKEAAHPLHGRLDLDRVVLVGHSRGGQAVTAAALFNRLERHPNDAFVRFDYGFGVRGVIGLAPIDGEDLGGGKTVLRNTDYLLLQGAQDNDVWFFIGARQFQRVVHDDGAYHFAASVYLQRANHAQFNERWGRVDWVWPTSRLLRRAPLLEAEEQQGLTKAYVLAFAEVTLRGRRRYLAALEDHRQFGETLPSDVYVTRFRDSSRVVVADFDEDADVTTGSRPGVRIGAEGLAFWYEGDPRFRRRQDLRIYSDAVYLGWKGGGEPAFYEIRMEGVEAPSACCLTFDMAPSLDDPGPDGHPRPRATPRPERLSFGLEVERSDGTRKRISSTSIRPLPPAMVSHWTKPPVRPTRAASTLESTFQTFRVPLAAFFPDLEASDVAAVRWVFDESEAGAVIVDDVAFVADLPTDGP